METKKAVDWKKLFLCFAIACAFVALLVLYLELRTPKVPKIEDVSSEEAAIVDDGLWGACQGAELAYSAFISMTNAGYDSDIEAYDFAKDTYSSLIIYLGDAQDVECQYAPLYQGAAEDYIAQMAMVVDSAMDYINDNSVENLSTYKRRGEDVSEKKQELEARRGAFVDYFGLVK
ncbi:hypothetical protein [Oscillibacter ruminantium]|uniref:hypothetical protein n=1 Tax=Oscillibacter ruminantium TaxID=1263547 RepID=UPI003332C203